MKTMTFEESLLKLNQITQQLESGELTLENSIKLYQDGIDLSVFCKKELENAQLKVQQYEVKE